VCQAIIRLSRAGTWRRYWRVEHGLRGMLSRAKLLPGTAGANCREGFLVEAAGSGGICAGMVRGSRAGGSGN